MAEIVEIQGTPNQIVIGVGGSVGIVEIPNIAEIQVLQIQAQGVAGADGAGIGIDSVEDDTSPTLGGNLTLNGFHFIGEVANDDFLIDGGLLG